MDELMEELSDMIITKHALEKFEERYHKYFPLNNPPKRGFEYLIKRLFAGAEKLQKPPRMRPITYLNKRLVDHSKAEYFLSLGWIFVVETAGSKQRIITIYRQ